MGRDRFVQAATTHAVQFDSIFKRQDDITLKRAPILDGSVNANLITIPSPKFDPGAARIAIELIAPQVDSGQFPVRRIVGSSIDVEADLISDGHGKLAGEIHLRSLDEKKAKIFPLRLVDNDRWTSQVKIPRIGRYAYSICAWLDRYASFVDEVTKKLSAGVNVTLELQEGLGLISEASVKSKSLSQKLAKLLNCSEEVCCHEMLSDEMVSVMSRFEVRKHLTFSHEIIIDSERKSAEFGSWYEVFPRSQSNDGVRHGTFRDVKQQLSRISEMGFDVLYFPPIHPIGEKNRKGRNNALTAGPGEPGSPYAIGSKFGGHDSIHPELGTLDDFLDLIRAARDHNIEIALDFAIQCAPDHPWLKSHKEWFDWRSDGSLRYAENPPKKYQDIVNVDFYTQGAIPSLWYALRDIVKFWVGQGIRIFRVDNPHTKPLPFWEWLISDIRAKHPDTIFLAEAFTRPKMMYRLAKIGFSQSYTYFTWRQTKQELEAYLTELTQTSVKNFFRPHFFVNTPDINPVYLQNAPRSMFLIRAALASTLSGLWGVYNGFELCESEAINGKEEYLDSEKYQIKSWDYSKSGNIIKEISQLNHIRKTNSSLQSHLNIEFLPCSNDQILYFRKYAPDGNCLLIAISLDAYNHQEAVIELPLWRFGLTDDGNLDAEDLFRGIKFSWHGKYQPAYFNPGEIPFSIWRVSKPSMESNI